MAENNLKTMSNKIYWRPCDRWVENKIKGKIYRQHVAQELVCDNVEVEKVWLTGSLPIVTGGFPVTHLNVLCRDGHREEFKLHSDQIEHEMDLFIAMEKTLDKYFAGTNEV